MFKVKRDEKEINELLNDVMDADNEGERRFPGMSYEAGVSAAIEWLLGWTDEHPYPEA